MTAPVDTRADVLPADKVKVPAPPGPGEHPPVSVNGVEISAAAIRAEAQQHPADTPARALAEAARALVIRELLLQEASAKGIAAEPEALGDGRREADVDAAVRALLEQEVTTPTADEAACRRYYEANPARFRSETLYEARHILFAAAPSDEAARKQARSDAEAVIAVLAGDPSQFAALAVVHSACPSKEQGGNLGQLTRGSTVPEFETVLCQLEEGQLAAAPVPTRFGYHVIQLDRLIPGQQLPFGMERERIAAWLEAASWSRAVSQFIGILAGKAEIHGIDLEAADGPLVR